MSARICRSTRSAGRREGHGPGPASGWGASTGWPCFERALALTRRLGARLDEAEVLDHLGDAYAALDRSTEARATWRQALAILDEWADPDAARVHAKIA